MYKWTPKGKGWGQILCVNQGLGSTEITPDRDVTYRKDVSYTFMTTTSRDPNTVTVIALKIQETPTTMACLLGTLQMENTLSAERIMATAETREKEMVHTMVRKCQLT